MTVAFDLKGSFLFKQCNGVKKCHPGLYKPYEVSKKLCFLRKFGSFPSAILEWREKWKKGKHYVSHFFVLKSLTISFISATTTAKACECDLCGLPFVLKDVDVDVDSLLKTSRSQRVNHLIESTEFSDTTKTTNGIKLLVSSTLGLNLVVLKNRNIGMIGLIGLINENLMSAFDFLNVQLEQLEHPWLEGQGWHKVLMSLLMSFSSLSFSRNSISARHRVRGLLN